MYLRICGSLKSAKIIGSANRKLQKIYGPQIANPQITSPQISNPQIATFAEGPQIPKKLDPQFCRFAICGTYLRTAHLW